MLEIGSRRIGTSNLRIAPLGFGGGPLGGLMDSMADSAAYDAVDAAIRAKLNYFDTSPFYGHGLSEHRIGDALRRSNSTDYVLSTKVGRLLRPDPAAKDSDLFKDTLRFSPAFDYSYDGAMRSFEDSLQRLGLPQADIVFIHDVSPNMQGDRLEQSFKQASNGAAKALSRLRDEKVVKAIGVAVSDWKICMRFAEVMNVDVFMLAVRYTLLDQTPVQEFLPFCRARGISVIAAAPFVSGILATGAVPGARYMYKTASEEILQRTRAIEAICSNHNIPLMAAALQMPIGDPAVCCVLPGFRSANEVNQAVDMIQFDIPNALWDELKDAGYLDPMTRVGTNEDC